ncbi:hypothetical protein [Bacillus bingmayongensis]|uniref:hypothetical protein n=1 Tax=Bacillus bingmayongensis TaxID=1150157 RepID=UPI0002F2D52F|nr:hypothetical protein [Bacillus bingmayongensis]
MDLFDEGYTLQQEALNELNEDKVKQDLEKITEGGKKWRASTENIGQMEKELLDNLNNGKNLIIKTVNEGVSIKS